MPSMSTCPEYRSQVEEAVSVSLVQPRRLRNLAVWLDSLQAGAGRTAAIPVRYLSRKVGLLENGGRLI
jgi:hypothetical protein